MSMSVLVFGSANADLVFRLPRLPSPGATVLGAPMQALPGGKGANQAVAAARDGARVAFAGAVGGDPFAAVALAALRDAGVDLAALATAPEPTGTAAILVDAAGANLIAVAPGANAHARAEQVPAAVLTPTTTLLMQMEVPPAEVAALAGRARARCARVILNLAPAAALPDEAFRLLDLLVVNEEEAAWLAARLGTGPDAASLRAALGCDVARTLGAAGAEAATAEGRHLTPPFPVVAVDTVGAGDCWCGVLAAALDRGASLAAAMRRASAAAALACTRPGAAAAMPMAAETEALLAATP
jgi:ribokinase